MVLLILTTTVLAVYIAVVIFFEHRRRYWTRKGVPSVQLEIPNSPSKELKPRYIQEQDLYFLYKKLGHKYYGRFDSWRPKLILIQPDLIKNILAKDFAHFMDRGVYYNEKHDPISAQLFNLEGQRWRDLRAKLTPTFTSGKMKAMFQTLLDCGLPMVEKLERQSLKGEAIDIKEVVACFTTDVIGSCAFGLECNSFANEKEDSAFRSAGKRFFGMNRLRRYRMILIHYFPDLCKALGVPMFEKSLTNFYFDVVRDTVKYREDNAISRNDFMQLLIELKNNKDLLGGLTIGEIAAQALLFFLAGFETSSTLMHFCFYELTQNPDVQERLRVEILETIKADNGRLTYDGIVGMKYLGQVLEETMRIYPPVPMLLRKCVKDYNIPETDVIIAAGTKVDIPVYSLHHDPEFFPNPKKFDPDRFTDENKSNRHPYVYMPFGEGPRICIGLRFGMMQAKVGMALILKDYIVKLHPKTVTPIGLNPTAFLMASKNTVWIALEKL